MGGISWQAANVVLGFPPARSLWMSGDGIKAVYIMKRGGDKNSMMPPGLVGNLKPEELAAPYFESLVGK